MGWNAEEEAARTVIVPVRTTGDRIQDRPLADLGGKGLFAKELEEALLAGEIDCAVHSLKDMPTQLPEGLVLDCVLPREDPRDALVCEIADSIAALPTGARFATGSVRRQAQLLNQRPDLEIVPLRGNVDTRLSRIKAGDAHATLLAIAGLNRLGKAAAARRVIDTEEMLPAVAQGAIGVESRARDSELNAMLALICHAPTQLAVTLERAFLAVLDGSCKTPIAGYARATGDNRMRFEGCALSPDGRQRFDVARLETVADMATAEAVGRAAGAEMLARAGQNFFRV